MAILRLLNEFGISTVLSCIEPARKCVSSCTYCFAELNSKAQSPGNSKNFDDKGTFESVIDRALGSDYDPTNFLQWMIRNRYPVGFANTVEPFQDLGQAKAILQTCKSLKIPLQLQTKGHNFFEVFPILESMADQLVMLVSFPTADDRALKRFEPKTSNAAHRIEVIKAASAAGIRTILGLSPYHEEWNSTPGRFVTDAASWGVKEVFLDRLHINKRQDAVAADRKMVEMAHTPYGEKFYDHVDQIHSAAIESGIDYYANDLGLPALGYLNTVDSITDSDSWRGVKHFPYYDGRFHRELDAMMFASTLAEEGDDESIDGPIVVEWGAALAAMERDGGIDQPFSMSTVGTFLNFKNVAPQLKKIVGKEAPIREYLRMLWNSPGNKPFLWLHPYFRVAVDGKDQPHRDEQGNLILLFDHQWSEKGLTRKCESLEDFSYYSIGD